MGDKKDYQKEIATALSMLVGIMFVTNLSIIVTGVLIHSQLCQVENSISKLGGVSYQLGNINRTMQAK